MSDSFKVSADGREVVGASPEELVVDSKYPHWKCDVKASPLHYGYIEADISAPTFYPNTTLYTIFTLEHGYSYTPSMLIIWDYPAGAGSSNQTYGMGTLSDELPLGVEVRSSINDKQLTIVIDNTINDTPISHMKVNFRYYIFAEGFPEYNYIVELDKDSREPRPL